MRHKSWFAGVVCCVLSTFTLAGSAPAGGLFGSGGCGGCGGGWGEVGYAPPIYSYAPPTITVVPHYVVQPNYVVERTVVLRPTEYLHESGCFLGCGGGGYLVNQGQYYDDPFLYSGYRSGGYYPSYRPAHYHSAGYGWGRQYSGYRLARFVSYTRHGYYPGDYRHW